MENAEVVNLAASTVYQIQMVNNYLGSVAPAIWNRGDDARHQSSSTQLDATREVGRQVVGDVLPCPQRPGVGPEIGHRLERENRLRAEEQGRKAASTEARETHRGTLLQRNGCSMLARVRAPAKRNGVLRRLGARGRKELPAVRACPSGSARSRAQEARRTSSTVGLPPGRSGG